MKVKIDFTNKEQLMSEDYLQAVGAWTKFLMGRMYGDDMKMVGTLAPQKISYLEEDDMPNQNFVIRGKYRDVKAYAQAIGREKDYIVAYAEYGEDHPIVARAKAELDKATNHFERLTGIKWPFK